MKNKEIKKIPLLPLRGLVVFPFMIVHFDIGRELSVMATKQAEENDNMVFLVLQKNIQDDNLSENDIFSVGTIAKIKQTIKLPDGTMRILVEGISRAEIVRVTQTTPYFSADVIEHDNIFEEDVEIHALARRCHELFSKYAEMGHNPTSDSIMGLMTLEDVGQLADIMIANMDTTIQNKQDVLETFDIKCRLLNLIKIIDEEIKLEELDSDIDNKVKCELDERQKEYFLREKIQHIKAEIGDDVDFENEAAEYANKMLTMNLPEYVMQKLNKEIARLKKMPFGAGEGNVIRTYIETVLELPWNVYTKENQNIKRAEKILNEDHYGLEKVKTRLLEHLAVKILSGKSQGTILCLVGPPGVGKTSIAKSIARSMNRNYIRISLGGVRDESDIRGHRKTYIGSMPGRIINAIKEAGSCNPLILLDEVDKMGSDLRGDPASALLEVLDSEQNNSFRDHFIELPFDLSKVMFIMTANTVDTIPYPLFDRMEIMEISGYTEDEKLNIAQKYLIPKQILKHGLKKTAIKIDASVIVDIINYYTKESGVRSLERKIGDICRKVARKYLTSSKKKITVSSKNLSEFLGEKIFSFERNDTNDTVGVATGLAWTQVGGDTLSIEVNVMDGSGKVELTGHLGDVMKESASAAISYIRSKTRAFGIEKDFYKTKDIHVHVPEGATPKDGPSAGITIATAITSALLDNPVKCDVAMTGEITLRGRVLPIGGLKEKSLAAYRRGAKTVIIPKENKKDLNDIPEKVRQNISFVCASSMEQVLECALVNKISEHTVKSVHMENKLPYTSKPEATIKQYMNEG